MTQRAPSRQSPHDVGGKPGYGAPQVDAEAPVFAKRWEATVFAMMNCIGARGVMKNTDQFRHAVERVDADAYYAHGYYGRWLGALETLLLEARALSREELDGRVGDLARQLGSSEAEIAELVAEHNIASRPRTLQPEALEQSLNAASSVRYLSEPPQFSIGDSVRTRAFTGSRAINSEHADVLHTRLPAYALGATGTVVSWHRGWVLPDTNAHGGGERPCHLYTVRFTAQALYGESAEASVYVHLDLFEPYLAPASLAQTEEPVMSQL